MLKTAQKEKVTYKVAREGRVRAGRCKAAAPRGAEGTGVRAATLRVASLGRAAQRPGSDAVPQGRWGDGMGELEMPEVVWGTWEGAQEDVVRVRDPRVVWSCLLARLEATLGLELGKGSARLPNFTAVASLLQIKCV